VTLSQILDNGPVEVSWNAPVLPREHAPLTLLIDDLHWADRRSPRSATFGGAAATGRFGSSRLSASLSPRAALPAERLDAAESPQ